MTSQEFRPTERQGLHAVLLLVLLAITLLLIRLPGMRSGSLAGTGTEVWFAIALAVPVLQQLYVALVWRLQLAYGNQSFRVYLLVFFVLFVLRMMSTIALAVANAGSLDLALGVRVAAAAFVSIPALYLFYSVWRYFGFLRAAGADHFDERYRTMPLVREGIFRYTSNGMYTYGLLALYIPGLITGSAAALTVALFQHAYVWVHYWCTELPDLRTIHGGDVA
ncbi:MAG: methyltransferase [Spirochaetaceae bacterium]